MFEWNSSMAIGVSEIDDQHRQLINKFNELVEAEANGADRKTIGGILDFLQHYAEWHFSTEEQVMEKYQCPVAEENKKAHNEYRAKFARLYEQWLNTSGSETAILHDTVVELARWIMKHILTVDNQLHEYLNRKSN